MSTKPPFVLLDGAPSAPTGRFEPAEARAAAGPAERAGREAPGRLLVLDDDAAVGLTLSLAAEGAGVEARFTARPAEFFALLIDFAPTHIALDLVMPELDGIEILRRLSDLRCRASIIITSGVGSRVLDAAHRAATEHGLNVVGVLPKPFSPARLRSLLSEGAPAAPSAVAASSEPPAPSRPSGGHLRAVLNEFDLRDALASDQITVYFQPKVHCQSGVVAGFEALVRWVHPVHGIIAPDRFVPVAERSMLINELTDRVLQQSLRWLGAQAAGPAPDGVALLMSVNISGRSLDDIDFASRLAHGCRAEGIEPSRVILEVTETCAMSDPVTSLEVLTRIRLAGFQLSIDDFGVGYSSLVQLARLPFSELKIDKTFVLNATVSEESRTMIKAIVGLGHSLGLRVTAEGVETEDCLAFLRHTGCDLAQGYHIGRPMPGPAAAVWLRAQEARLECHPEAHHPPGARAAR